MSMGEIISTAMGFARICLLGDHCDWANRQVIASSIDRRITATAEKRDDYTINVRASNRFHGETEEASFDLQEAPDMPISNSSLRYVNAVVVAILERFDEIGNGADINIDSNVPMRKGLSSSAAICIAASGVLSKLWGLDMGPDDLVRISYRAERGILGIACGMMDQTASVFDHPLFMDFSRDFDYTPIRLKRGLPIVIADVGGERNTRLILNTLNRYYLEEKDPLIVKTLGEDIPGIVRRARKEMETSCRLDVLGSLMNQNQECYDRGLRPYCESELGSPLLYRALEAAREGGALGAKWTGAGGSGSIIALAPDLEFRDELAEKLERCCRSVILTSIGEFEGVQTN